MDDARAPSTWKLATLAGAAAALVFLVLFRGAVFGGSLPHDVVQTDDVAFVGTVFERWAAQVRHGTVPLWFPEFDCGTPLAAAWMYGLLYPGLALFAALPLGMAWAWTAAIHAGIGAAGMTSFLRRRGCDAAGALAGAALFALSEHFVGRTACGHLNLVLPVAWVPWVLRFADGCVRGERRAVPLLALATGAGLLAGHVQVWIYLAPLVAAFAVAETWGVASPGAGRAAALRRLAVGAGLGVALAAAQIAVTVQFLGQAAPIAENAEVVKAVSVPPGVLVSKLLGGFLGPEPGRGDLGDFRHEFRGIAGIWAFGLAAWGAWTGGSKAAPRRWVWVLAAVLGLVASIGTRDGSTAWIQDLPPFSLARAPGRFLVLPLVAVSVLAGHGLSALPWGRPARGAAAAAVAVLALAYGTPGVASIPDTLFRADFASRLPADVRGHRVHAPILYQWTDLEASGLETLRTPCYVRTKGYADLLAEPSPAVAWWIDLGADLTPVVRPDASFTPMFEDVLQVRAQSFETMGRAAFFPSAAVGLADADVLARLRAGDRRLYVRRAAAGGDGAGGDGPSETTLRGATGTVRVVAADPRSTTLEADTTGPGWVLVSMRLYPGWTATIDGAPADLRRGNLAFPAVRVPSAGKHVIALTYTPGLFRVGAAISLLALGAVLALSLGTVLRNHRNPAP